MHSLPGRVPQVSLLRPGILRQRQQIPSTPRLQNPRCDIRRDHPKIPQVPCIDNICANFPRASDMERIVSAAPSDAISDSPSYRREIFFRIERHRFDALDNLLNKEQRIFSAQSMRRWQPCKNGIGLGKSMRATFGFGPGEAIKEVQAPGMMWVVFVCCCHEHRGVSERNHSPLNF